MTSAGQVFSRSRQPRGPAGVAEGRRVVVIGGGVGGLAAAIRLAAGGCRVSLLEKNDQIGGKLNRRIVPHPTRPHDRPFRFDTGPSLLTLPLVFADLFDAAGFDVRDFLSICRLDPVSRFVWPDGQTFDLSSDLDATCEQVRRISPRDVDGFRTLFERGRHVWDLAGEMFLTQSPEQALRRKDGDPPWKGLTLLTTPLRIGMFRRYASVIDRHLRHPRLRAVLYQYATYSGASPFRAPGTLAVIPFVELFFGGWYVEGGMYRVAEALAEVATRLGVEIHTGSEVSRIETTRDGPGKPRVVGVVTAAGDRVESDVVVVNVDVISAYRHLIAPECRPKWPDSRLNAIEPGGSGLVLLLGTGRTYPHLAHHTKFMPDDYAADLRAMFETRTLPTDPCVYVCASTRTDATQAPEGCENLFVLASAPPLDGSIDWSVASDGYRDKLVSTLERQGGMPDLSSHILVEERFTPQDLKSLYAANAGSIYGVGGNSRRDAFLRPPNRDRDVDGLFFAGGATHPGGGLPLVALSGKVASELALERLAGV